MSEQQHGVKETKEVAVGLIVIATMLATHFKDGVQVADAAAIFAQLQTDSELKAKLEAAYKDIELVKVETKEVSAAELIEVLMAVLPELSQLIKAIKK